MKIKCFSKRKLNVRISKTKIKCAILGLNIFPKFAAFWENPEKNWSNLAKFSTNSAQIQQILANFATSCKKSATFQQF